MKARARAGVYALIVLATMPAWFLNPFDYAGGAWWSVALPSKADFAAPITRVVYALAPWSPIVPFAIARRPARTSRASGILVMVSVVAMASAILFAGRGFLALACVAFAACIGTMLAELDETREPQALVAVGVFAIGAILAHDLSVEPDRVLGTIASSSLPSGHATDTARSVRIATMSVATATAVATFFARGSWREKLASRLPALGGGLLVIVVGALGGLFLRAKAYPSLVDKISPARAFRAWNGVKSASDEIALLGVPKDRWPEATIQLGSSDEAARWLASSGPGQRRFLTIGPSEHASLNAAHRGRNGGVNLPVLVGDGAFLLGVNRLLPNERSENPLDDIVRSTPPAGLHAIAAKLTELDVLGWSILDRDGNASAALPKRGGHLRIALSVHAERSFAGYCTFLHIDHSPTRFGAEHREHTYPIRLWRRGDVIVDDFLVDLPPHFGAGRYALYWGVGVLPCQDDQRMPIVSGPNDGRHRVPLGQLDVR